MFASCIPDIQKTNEVGILCQERLMSMFARNFNCPVYKREVGHELSNAREILKDYDAYMAIADLPRVFRRTRQSFPKTPFLKPDPQRLEEMRPYVGRTGVSWRGRNGYYKQDDFPKGLSLQYDIQWDEKPDLPHIDCREDLEGLLALVSVLDRVITVSSTVAHFAGAVGTRMDVIQASVETARSGNQLNWRWGLGESSYWYGNTFVYRNMEQYKRYHCNDLIFKRAKQETPAVQF